jgi:hypothetical protein
MSDRQKFFIALAASVLIHLGIAEVVVIFLAVVAVLYGPKVAPKGPPPDLSQLTVTLMPPPPETPSIADIHPVMPPPPPPPDIDSDGLTPSAKAPDHPVFQSDANMVAGSQLPATGSVPLPSMAGPNRKFVDFGNRAASMGKGQSVDAGKPSRPTAPSQEAPPMPVQTPNGITQVQQTPAPVPTPQPTPGAVAQSTPAPTPKPLPSAPPESLALGKPTPTPAPAPTPMQLARLTIPPTMRAQAEIAPPVSRPATPEQRPPAPPGEPGTQREMEQTHIDGGINRPGRPAVDAVETPFGRYHRQLSNLIGSRWKLYLQDHPKDVGEVTIVVKLDPSGHVTATKVVQNHSLDDLAELSTRAIMESDLPPVPDDLAPMLRDGKLEISFNFNVYDATNDSPGR